MLDPIANVTDPARRADAERLDAIFRDVTGFRPRLWGKKIGYGQYHYRYDSGREGDWLATLFSSPLAIGLAIAAVFLTYLSGRVRLLERVNRMRDDVHDD